MKSYTSHLYLLVFYVTTSCTEDYQLPNSGIQTTIVITGLITNEQGPYYVRVVENVSDISKGITIQRPINDARITITDSNGSVDELQSFYDLALDSVLIVWVRPDWWWGDPPPDEYEYFYNIPDANGGYFKFVVGKWSYYDIREGVYYTTSIKGVPGRTYALKVEYEGQEYTATDYMCYGTVIDSISVEPIGKYINDKPDGTDGFLVPCLYFAEPKDEVNFYMFKEGGIYVSYNTKQEWEFDAFVPAKNVVLNNWGGEDWYISVVSDRFMPPYVSKYKMSDGDHARKWFQGTDMGFYYGRWDSGGAIDMYCITEPVYRYYFALSRQYYEDGGAFSSSPASPPTNISGGAQGCFSAASVSQYFLDLRNEK